MEEEAVITEKTGKLLPFRSFLLHGINSTGNYL